MPVEDETINPSVNLYTPSGSDLTLRTFASSFSFRRFCISKQANFPKPFWINASIYNPFEHFLTPGKNQEISNGTVSIKFVPLALCKTFVKKMFFIEQAKSGVYIQKKGFGLNMSKTGLFRSYLVCKSRKTVKENIIESFRSNFASSVPGTSSSLLLHIFFQKQLHNYSRLSIFSEVQNKTGRLYLNVPKFNTSKNQFPENKKGCEKAINVFQHKMTFINPIFFNMKEQKDQIVLSCI